MSDMPEDNNGWHEYKLLVIDRLDNLQENVKELTDAVNKLKNEVIAIKIKSGLWGALAGSVPALITMLVYMAVKTK